MNKILKHPTKKRVKAICGADRTLGLFINLERGESIVAEYDRIHDGYDGVPGALKFLASHGFFTAAEAGLGLMWVRHSLAEEAPAEEPGVRLAAEAAEALYSLGA